MAAAAAAALLDELMGRNRNAAPNEKTAEINWEDPDYCKYYMVQFCPHDLFVNTRADLGACPKLHDDEVKRLYDESSSYKKVQFMDEFIRFCTNILNEVHRKIDKGKQRLQLMANSENIQLTPLQTQRNTEQIALLSDKINKLVEEAEAAGIQGNVEQAQGLMKLCDQLKEERTTLRKQVENSQWQETANLAAQQEKLMEVCEVCGAFLIVGDAQQRIDDHLMGKQHVGYARLKIAVNDITKLRDSLREEREKKRETERRDRGYGGSRRDRERSRDVEREHGRERDRGGKDERERDRGGKDERERDRGVKDDRERDRGGKERLSRRHDDRRDRRRERSRSQPRRRREGEERKREHREGKRRSRERDRTDKHVDMEISRSRDKNDIGSPEN